MCIATSSLPSPTPGADRAPAVAWPRLLRAYRQTRYTADGIEIRVGRRNAAMDAWLAAHGAQTGVLITAWNPRSRRMPRGWNARMQHHLAEHIRRCACVDAEGRLRQWHEAQLLVLCPPELAERIARRFRQRGIVVLRRHHPARLIILPDRCRPVGIRPDSLARQAPGAPPSSAAVERGSRISRLSRRCSR